MWSIRVHKIIKINIAFFMNVFNFFFYYIKCNFNRFKKKCNEINTLRLCNIIQTFDDLRLVRVNFKSKYKIKTDAITIL